MCPYGPPSAGCPPSGVGGGTGDGDRWVLSGPVMRCSSRGSPMAANGPPVRSEPDPPCAPRVMPHRWRAGRVADSGDPAQPRGSVGAETAPVVVERVVGPDEPDERPDQDEHAGEEPEP